MKTLRVYLQYLSMRSLILFTLIAALLVSIVADTSQSDAATISASVSATTATRCSSVASIGHRGTSASGVKQNSLAAFQLAVQSGVRTIEFDIHRTKPEHGSGQWIVHHDASIKGRKISKTKYSTLKKLEPSLITYRQAMAYLKNYKSVRALPEIKPSSVSKGSLKYIARVANDYGMRSRTDIQSFNKSVLVKWRKYNKGFRTAYLVSKVKYSAKSIRKFANIVIFNKSLILSKKVSVSSYRAAGLIVYAYTPNSSADWARLVNAGVNGIITDYAKSYSTWCGSIRQKLL